MKVTRGPKALGLLALVVILLVCAGCSARPKIGDLQTESQSVELGSAEAVQVEIAFGAGELAVTGAAEKLMEADFAYNVARLKPEVAYTDGKLVIRQPEINGLPVLRDMMGFRNEWALKLNEDVPMDLSVDMGAGTSDLQLAGLSLTGLKIKLGAGKTTIDLSGSWSRDLDVTISAGAGDVSLLLPGDVGARVDVDTGLGTVSAKGLTKDGDVYTNAAYGVSEITLQVKVDAGVGTIDLQAAESSPPDTGASPKPDYSGLTAELSKQIQAVMAEAGVVGLSVALVDDQNIVWSEGFGYADKENGVKAAPDTVYMLASISKLYTASAIMQLSEQGKLDIDQPLQTYLPEFSTNSRFPDADPITARSLMTHHSGLPSDWINGEFAFGDDHDDLTRTEFANLVTEIRQAYVTAPPNTKFSYSNLGYSILGHVVEQASGQGFIDYMDEALLQPLGMESSYFTVRPDLKPRLSKEYLKGEVQEHVWGRDLPAGSLFSTVEDQSRFMMMQFNDGELDGQRILSADTLAEMLTPQNDDVPLDFHARWGLGWWLPPLLDYAGANAWHSGGEGKWSSYMFILPDHKLGVVVLSNSYEAGDITLQLVTGILEGALKVKTGLERPQAEPQKVGSLSAQERSGYEGLYTTDLGWITIRSEGSDLYADAVGQTFRLLPHGAGSFSIEGVNPKDAQLYIKAVDGRTVLFIYGFTFGMVWGERVEPTAISQAWMDRLGSYEITNARPGFPDFIKDMQLKIEDDFLIFSATRVETGEQFSFPLTPLNDDEAVTMGLGLRSRGDTIGAVAVDGEEQLFYTGYLMKKVASEAQGPAPAGNVYTDPQGRFSLPLVGSWTPLETDGSYGLFEVTGFDLKMSVHGAETGDLAAGEATAFSQAGIDPATLTKTDEAKMGQWNINFYALGGGRGVSTLCQVVDQMAYCLVFSGAQDLTENPPEHVFTTFEGFTVAGHEAALPATIEEFEALVNSFVGELPPGLAVVITRGGEPLYSKGFGMADGPKGMVAEPDTVFMWGSMTKTVTGVAVMQLVDQGLVDLDAPVSDYLDYFPAEHGITVRQLLDHSSGLDAPVEFNTVNLNLDGQPLTDPDRVAREYLQGLPKPVFAPGSAAFYSNPGYVMLGQIVAEVSGQPYVEYVREHILRPLGLENTDFSYSTPIMLEKAAAPAIRAAEVETITTLIDQSDGPVRGAELIREVDDKFAWMVRYNVMAANGGLIGPAVEAIRFAQMHLNGGELDGVRILSPEAAAQMQEMQLSTGGEPLGYGLTWRVFDKPEHAFIEHDGGGVGLWAKMRLYPAQGVAILFMSNASGWNRDLLADAAANVVFALTGP